MPPSPAPARRVDGDLAAGEAPLRLERLRALAVNGRFLTQRVTGVQRYAREVVGAIDALICSGDVQGVEVTVLVPPADVDLPAYKAVRIERRGRLRGHVWEQLELPRLAGGRLLLGLCNTGPAALRRQAVTLHDAVVFERPEAFSTAFRAWYHVLMRRLARVSQGLFTGSRFSRDALAQHLRVPPERFAVIHHGREHVLRAHADATAPARLGLATRPYILAVSSRSPHKNFAALGEAARQLAGEADVVVVGGGNARVFAADAALPDGVRSLGYVDDASLRALYEHALCLVYPSWYEGFGFPPLEAMTCGCPVVVSRTASLPEVCGDAALYFDPHAADAAVQIARHVRAILTDGAARARCVEAGLRQAQAFSWAASARAHLSHLEQLSHA